MGLDMLNLRVIERSTRREREHARMGYELIGEPNGVSGRLNDDGTQPSAEAARLAVICTTNALHVRGRT